ncbi:MULTISPECIES: heavy metal-responsive transcriptional regulator [unclassified Streptomyces]|uniref:heavy metal-responsive transcriptional regulator n=1 Tax=unclassified Streptomyces TaxID=2593676 RepID=UPI0016604272|nr:MULTISPECIES: heavy metal-responsive transcriptional regulator [unclassified Streptomyces]MBD0710485.1 heavy metal-responsive transcriptional regulator [Streptomyces sp. CBMA291]MBD0717357.1 heavy metal-responsive transcriptional regulator [Streptomyces sp. CBMA370]
MRIGDLAAASGVTAKTLRFYEQSGLLPAPPRTPGGYRDYPGEAVARLAFIRDAQGAGLTLAEIRSVLVLRDGGQAPCAQVTALVDRRLVEIDRRLAELSETREALRLLARRAAAVDPAGCAEGDICTILATPGGDTRTR